MTDHIDWQVRAVAAEVALETIFNEVGAIAEGKIEKIRNERTAGEADGWIAAMVHICGIIPDLAASREAERAFCDAALAYADAKASIEDQAAEYKRTLAALQAARGRS